MNPLQEKLLKAIEDIGSTESKLPIKELISIACHKICLEENSIELSNLLEIKYLTKDDVIRRIAEIQTELKN